MDQEDLPYIEINGHRIRLATTLVFQHAAKKMMKLYPQLGYEEEEGGLIRGWLENMIYQGAKEILGEKAAFDIANEGLDLERKKSKQNAQPEASL